MGRFQILKNKKVYLWLLSQIKAYRLQLFLLIGLNMMMSLVTVSIAIITKYIIDHVIKKELHLALQFVLIFAVVEALQIIAAFIYPILRTSLREKLTNQLQSDFFKQFYQLEWLTSSKHHTGEFQTYLTNDIPRVVNGMIDITSTLFAFTFQLIIAFLALLYYDPLLAVFAFLIGPVTVLFSKIWGLKLKRLQHLIQNTESKYMSLINETLENNLIIKVFRYERGNQRSLSNLQHKRYGLYMQQAKTTAVGTVALNVGFRSSFFIAFIWGAYRISIGAATFGTFTAFLQLIGNIQEPIEILSQTFPKIINTMTSAERLIEYENYPKEKAMALMDKELPSPLGIRIRDLSWKYSSEQQIFQHTTLHIRPGLMTGLVGGSGLGKTTLFYILLGLIQPINGQVELYGEDKTQVISGDTRQFISYVPQGNTLFSGTIYDNLCIAKPTATEEEINKVLIIACAYDFVMQLPERVYTVIGERGIGLSVGQAQRLCIARALLNNAPILLLDEATSALDMRTETQVLNNIKKHLKHKTCITISHRHSILALCEQVFELKEQQFHPINRVKTS